MKSETFIHYNSRLKNKIVRTTKNLVKLLKSVKQELINFVCISNYYYSEISIKFRVFRYNAKYINRF